MELRILLLIALTTILVKQGNGARSFSIDYDNDRFLKDGQPFRYISGSIHYARVHPKYWQDRLDKMYAAGLNAIQTYVPWNLHEPTQGKYNFDGFANLTQFLSLANQTNLLVIARVGPYICGEWDMGGLPSWLLRLNHTIQLRTADPTYLSAVDDWMNVLLPKIKPFLYKNGGPIISVQVENEYGSYAACDHNYMRHLYQLFHSNLGSDVVYFTTDGPSTEMLTCGTLQNVYATVDFGAGSDPSVPFAKQKKFEPHGPSVNSEYYTGWLDHWGEKHQTVDQNQVAKKLDDMLQLGASVNMYMFEGGTNFGVWNGANGAFKPQPTSYDYDAPLSEAGDPTDKYFTLRKVIGKYNKLPDVVPPATPKTAYGIVTMETMTSLYDALDTISPYEPIRATYPITMEDMQQSFGYILYRSTLTQDYPDAVDLSVPGIHDRGYVMINQQPVGILERLGPNSLNITCQQNDTLDILVENMGRVNFGKGINDFKGLVNNVTLDGIILQPWQIYSLDLDRLISKASLPRQPVSNRQEGQQQVPTFYVGNLPEISIPRDTYLKISAQQWSKGQAYINGFNLGRYWPTKGPQVTLYVPGPILKPSPANNTLVLFELEYTACGDPDASQTCTVEFIDRPIINATVHPLPNTVPPRSFVIDYEHNRFLKDGQPFRYISGSIHYARVHPKYWQDRLDKMYAAGLNAIQTYVPWNLHEPTQGKYNFDGIANLTHFLTLANKTGLLVIARVGPYICANWDMGGLPSWLLHLNPSMQLRTADPTYTDPVDSWMNVLLPKIKPFLYKNGGPIISVQIENEYGSYPACDHDYMSHLYHIFHTILGDDVVYFTTDGPVDKNLRCGSIHDTYATVDFGSGQNASAHFAMQRKYAPYGPSVNSEYYPGWFDHWGKPHNMIDKEKIAKSLDEMLMLGASVNIYMFEGGTSFGFWVGANMEYKPQCTTYDYDAPLTEAGDPTDKYYAIKDVISKYKAIPPVPIPPATPKQAYGMVTMKIMASLYDALDVLSPKEPIKATYPLTMEAVQQSYGFILYRTTLTKAYSNPVNLSAPGIHDRGYVMINQTPVGIVERLGPNSLNITCQRNDTLDILVENMGRVNFGLGIKDFKGLVSNVTLDGIILQQWQIYSLDLDRLITKASLPRQHMSNRQAGHQQVPTFYVGNLPEITVPQDTYLKISAQHWSKGQAYINGFNLGRYWPTKGPQITLYVPGPILKPSPANNTLVLFELESTTCGNHYIWESCSVDFIDSPMLNGSVEQEVLYWIAMVICCIVMLAAIHITIFQIVVMCVEFRRQHKIVIPSDKRISFKSF